MYLKCSTCGHFNAVKTEYLIFCSKCNKKLINNYSDWSKQNSDKTFEDYKQLICTNEIVEAPPEKTKTTKSKILTYLIAMVVFVAIIFATVLFGSEKIKSMFRKQTVDQIIQQIDSSNTQLNSPVSSDPNISKEFSKACVMFLAGDFNGCIPLYKNILEKEDLLYKDFWYVLIDNLGMAYGITGDLSSAEEVFKHGLSRDSTYPLFYYNLACTYAEKDDMNTCIDYLKNAFKYKKNVLQGEIFPDPATDDTFQKFMNNDQFVSAINELKSNK
jgi:tetratricopeptide (TPR) repeat protein